MLFVNSGRADALDLIGPGILHQGHQGIDPNTLGRYKDVHISSFLC